MSQPEPTAPAPSSPRSRRVRRSALEHYDAAPVRKVPLERWTTVLGRIEPAVLQETPRTMEEVVGLLTSGESGPRIRELLHALHDFGTASGAQAIHEAAIEIGLDRSDWPQAVEELAVEVWSRALDAPEYETVLRFAEIAVHDRQTELRCREFSARTPSPLRCERTALNSLEEDLRPWFQKEGMGGAVAVKVHEEADRHVLCISHGARVQSEATVGDDGDQGLLTFRPLMCDVVSYERESGRLRVSARSRRLVDAYRQAVGRTFFGDCAFFEERPIYTLSPFLDAIRNGSLPPPPPELGIRAVIMVGCVWNTGDGIVHRIYGRRGRDCTEQAQRARFHPEHDDLAQVTVAFLFDGERRPERVDVVVREDNRLDCRKPIHRDAIDAYLEHIGARRPRAQALLPKPLTQLAGIQAASRWMQALGGEMRAAVDSGVLALRERPAVGNDGALRDVSSYNDNATLAVDDGALALIRPDLLVGYELNPRFLGELLRTELGCRHTLVDLPLAGVHDLGPLTIGTVQVRPILVTRFIDDPAATERLLQNAVGSQERFVTIHLPHTDVNRWTRAFPLAGITAPFRVRAGVIRVLRLEDEVPALELADGERLVVDVVNRATWLDEVPLQLTDADRATLMELTKAWKSGRRIPSKELSTLLGGPTASGDLGKQRVKALKTAIKNAFAETGKEPPEVVQVTRRGEGYSLALKPYVRE